MDRHAHDHRRHRGTGRLVLRALLLTLLGLFFATTLAGVGLLLSRNAAGLTSVMRALLSFRPYAYAIQFALIGLLWWKWAPLIDYLVDKNTIPPAARDELVQRRNRWLLTLFVFEVIMFVFTTPGASH
jgi:hypothetical protein